MTVTIDQIKEWKVLHNMFNDAQRMHGDAQHDYLHTEVYPRLREYTQKYATKYDHLTKPR